MWQRFTERARRVVFFAQEEAGRLGTNHISTEHLLLGLVRENDSAAARILDRVGVALGRIRSEIERQVARGSGRLGQDMELTAGSRRVIDLAYDEARHLDYIGTEHLLLGLIREGEGLAGRVLNKLGVDLERTRREVMQLRATEPQADGEGAPGRQDLLRGAQEAVKQLLEHRPDLAGLPDGALARLLAGEAVQASAAPQPETGDLGLLRYPDGERSVEIAVDEHSLLELVAILRARDYHGYRGLVADGRICLLPAGTGAKILHPAHLDLHRAVSLAIKEVGAHYIRILDGDQEGQAAWVVPEAFQRTGPDTTPFPPLISDVEQECGSDD